MNNIKPTIIPIYIGSVPKNLSIAVLSQKTKYIFI